MRSIQEWVKTSGDLGRRCPPGQSAVVGSRWAFVSPLSGSSRADWPQGATERLGRLQPRCADGICKPRRRTSGETVQLAQKGNSVDAPGLATPGLAGWPGAVRALRFGAVGTITGLGDTTITIENEFGVTSTVTTTPRPSTKKVGRR